MIDHNVNVKVKSFVIVYNCDNGKYQYIRFNKSSNTYTREYRGGGFKNFTMLMSKSNPLLDFLSTVIILYFELPTN